jgi:16S rRNA (guanine(966)-N(2))-methyltransferase RsmD
LRIIGGNNKGLTLKALEGSATRPTLDRIKTSLFDILQFRIRQSAVLDLFGGSGSLSLEAISRGAGEVVINDISADAIKIIRANCAKMKASPKIFNEDYAAALTRLNAENFRADIIFIDPPYESDYGENAIELVGGYKMLKAGGIIIFETLSKKHLILNRKDYIIKDIRKYGKVSLIFIGELD